MPTVALFSDKEFADPPRLSEEEFRANLEKQIQEHNRNLKPGQSYIYTDGHGHMVDYSDPVSYTSAQNPPDPGRIIYTESYQMNPNLRPPDDQLAVNPNGNSRQVYVAAPTTLPVVYCGGPYVSNTMRIMTPEETAKFMIPLPGDTKLPHGVIKWVPREPEFPKFEVAKFENGRPVRRNSHLEALKDLKVTIVNRPIENAKPIKKGSRIKYITVYDPPPHEPHKPFTQDELDTSKWRRKVIADSPLNWTEEDEKELRMLQNEIAVYDEATAYVFYWFVHEEKFNHNNWAEYDYENREHVTREDYEFLKMYVRQLIEDYRQKEAADPDGEIDYRADYEHRPLPPCMYLNNTLYALIEKPLEPARRFRNEDGEWEYEINRVRDFDMDIWDMFANRAFVEMILGTYAIKMQEERRINTRVKREKKEPTLPPYDPKDLVSVRLYAFRQREIELERTKEFFRDVLSYKFDDDEFEEWWNGDSPLATTVRGPNQVMSKEESHREWAKQMTVMNVRFLETLKPIDVEAARRESYRRMNEELQHYQRGAIRPDMSLGEFFQHLRYLGDLRLQEMRQEEALNKRIKDKPPEQVQLSANTSINYANNSYYNQNPNPYFNNQYGTIDPRIPPMQEIDITNIPHYANYQTTLQSRQYNQPIKTFSARRG